MNAVAASRRAASESPHPAPHPPIWPPRVVDVMEELVKFTLLTRDASRWLTDRYSERRESAEGLSKRVNQRSI